MKLAAAFLAICLSGAAIAAPVKFSDRLHEKFQHDRCLQCHQFNSTKNNGRAFASHKSRYLCSQCHNPGITGIGRNDWMAPDASLDQTGMSAKATCQLMKRSMGNDNRKILEHLLHDARIIWALKSGMTPGGKKDTVPGGLAEWERDVRAWAADGMLCE